MKNDKLKILFITVAVLIIIFLIFFLGIKIYQKQFNSFKTDGHIIAEIDNKKTERYYFTEGTKYKKTANNNVTFNNTNGQSITIPDDTLIHYSNESISVLKKAVLLDLNSVNDSIIKYYNIFEGSILNKINGKYTLKNLNDNLSFDSLLVKISDNRYLLSSNNMNVIIGDTTKEVKNNYIEVTFFDGNIARVENQEISYQNASNQFFIQIGNVKIDLSTKNVYYDGTKTLNLSQITIDSSDNVEVSSEENDVLTDEKGNEIKEEKELPKINSGEIDTINDKESIIKENQKYVDPQITIKDFKTTINKMSCQIEINDSDELLNGDIYIKIIETASNKLVYETKETGGLSNISVETSNLKAGTNYIMIVNSNYIKGSVEYNKDFIQKTFITENLGIDIAKNYFTSNKISFSVSKSEYSTVNGMNVSLCNKNTGDCPEKYKKTLEFGNDKKLTLEFTELEKNTEYSLVIYGIILDDYATEGTIITNQYRTLKETPTVGNVEISTDRKNGVFTISPVNVSDSDQAIVSYKYNIYNQMNDSSNEDAKSTLVKTIEKTNKNSFDLELDGQTIKRNEAYYCQLIVTYNDNDKEIEKLIGQSEIMYIGSKEFPTVLFEESADVGITFESINGNIVIHDPDKTISSKKIIIQYTDSLNRVNEINYNSFDLYSSEIRIPINLSSLTADQKHVFKIIADIDLDEGGTYTQNDVFKNCVLRTFTINTKIPSPLEVKIDANKEDTINPFNLDLSISGENHELNSLGSIKFSFYSDLTNNVPIRTVEYLDHNSDKYISDLKSCYASGDKEVCKSFNYANPLTPTNLGLTDDDFNKFGKCYLVITAMDYAGNAYKFKTINGEENSNIYIISINSVLPLPSNVKSSMDVKTIRNRDYIEYGFERNEKLLDNTAVGYDVKAYDSLGFKENDKREYDLVSITYCLNDKNTGNRVIDSNGQEICKTVESTENTVPSEKFYFDELNFKRGKIYYFTWTAIVQNIETKEEFVYPTDTNKSGEDEEIVVLKSSDISSDKQEPIFKTYLSSTSNNSAKWQYYFSDIDDAVHNKQLFYTVGTNEYSIDLTNHDQSKKEDYFANNVVFNEEDTLEIDNLLNGNEINTYYYSNKIETETPKTETSKFPLIQKYLFFQTYRFPYDTTKKMCNYDEVGTDYSNCSSILKLESNRLLIYFPNEVAEEDDFFKRISNVTVRFDDTSSEPSSSITLDNLVFEKNSINNEEKMALVIDLYHIQNLMGKDLTVSMNIYYDNNLSGFDITGKTDSCGVNSYVTLKNILTGEYYYKNSLDIRSDAYESLYCLKNYALDGNKISPDLTNVLSNEKIELKEKIEVLSGGTVLNFSPIIPNKIEKVTILSSSSINFSEVPIATELISRNIGITTASFKIKTYGDLNISDIVPYINDFVPSYTIDAEKGTINLTNLNVDTNYIVKFKINDKYIRDLRFEYSGYSFFTKSAVDITNLSVKYNPNGGYNNHAITISYHVDQVVGYSKMRYEIKWNEGNIIKEETSDKFTSGDITYNFPIPPGSSIVTGNDYTIKISPIATNAEGKDTILNTKEIVYSGFTNLSSPITYFNVSLENQNLKFGVLTKDNDKVIKNDCKIVTQTLNTTTKESIESELTFDPSENDGRKYISISNFQSSGYKYTIKVSCDVDRQNDGGTSKYTSSYETSFETGGIDLGSVDVLKKDESQVELRFRNSINLSAISYVEYSIINSSGTTVVTKTRQEFNPTSSGSENDIFYSYCLNNIRTSGGTYIIIQTKFYDANGNYITEKALKLDI